MRRPNRATLLLTALAMLFVIAVALLALGAPAHARDEALPGKPFHVCAEFLSNPTAVVVDVFELGGTQIGNNVTATRVTLDSVGSSVWCLDLDAVTGFAPSCDRKTYAVRFVPDAANCAASSTPSLCATSEVASGGAACWNYGAEPTVVYTSVPIVARGITQSVINRGNPSYIKHEVKLETGVVVFTLYQVFYYDASGRVERTLRSLTVPNP